MLLGDWYDGNVVELYDRALAVGTVRVSDAFTINGLPGDLFNCSKQRKSSHSNVY